DGQKKSMYRWPRVLARVNRARACLRVIPRRTGPSEVAPRRPDGAAHENFVPPPPVEGAVAPSVTSEVPAGSATVASPARDAEVTREPLRSTGVPAVRCATDSDT